LIKIFLKDFMRNFYLICCLVLFYFNANSQNLSAEVLDFEERPIEGVKVFYDQTTISTFTDKNGVFELPVNIFIPEPKLIFYHPNYELHEVSAAKELRSEYYLKAKLETKKDDSWNDHSDTLRSQKLYDVFRENFLGKSFNTRKTKILNEDVIQVKFDTLNYILEAKASQPLQIQNEALGYQMEYHIKDFKVEYSADTLSEFFIDYKFLYGYSLFKDIGSSQRKERKERAKAFENTLNHFFVQIINEKFREIRSKVGTEEGRIRPRKMFYVQKLDNGTYKLSLQDKMLSLSDDGDFKFYIKPHNSLQGTKTYRYDVDGFPYAENRSTEVISFRPYLLVDRFGNLLDNEYFEVSGEILEIDLSDMLPLEYNLNSKK